MPSLQRRLFWIALTITALAGLWSYGWYSATSALYSDLPKHGIRIGSPAYSEIVTLTRRQIRLIALPFVGLTVAALVGWGSMLFASFRNGSQD